MTSKTIIIGLVAIAFVAGSIMTGTMAEAKKDKSEGNDNNPFKAIWDAIAGLQTQIDGIELTSDLGDTYRVTGSDQGSGQTIEAEASCDEGDILLSCGFFKASSSVTINGAVPFPETQSCIAFAIVSGDSVESVTAFAVCADTDPPHENDD